MNRLRNLPMEEAKLLSELITVKEHKVVSMALSNSDQMQMMLLAFAKGENVSEEQYFGDTFYYVVEGKVTICFSNKEVHIKEGEVFMVPEGILHALTGKDAFKILQITLNNQ